MQKLKEGDLRGGALFTQAVNLEPVAEGPKAVLPGDLLLKLLDARILELDDGAAPGADKMVVVVLPGGRFVPGLAVAEIARLGDAALGEKPKGAVDRGVADAGVLFTQLR